MINKITLLLVIVTLLSPAAVFAGMPPPAVEKEKDTEPVEYFTALFIIILVLSIYLFVRIKKVLSGKES